jgi:O-antigen/teichoic acid export membrane protein
MKTDNISQMSMGREKLLMDITYTSFVPVLTALRSIILIILISKAMGPFGIGLWGQITATLAMVQVFATLNLGHSMNRFIPSYNSRLDVADDLYSILAIVSGLVLLITAFGLVFNNFFAMVIFDSKDQFRLVICLMGLICTECLYAEQIAFLRASRRNKKWSFITFCKVLMDISAVLAGTIYFNSIFVTCLLLISVEGILITLLFFVIIKDIGIVIPRFRNIKSYLAFGLPLLPATVSFWAISMGTRYFVKFYLGLEAVGIYSVCWSISNIFVLLYAPVTSVLLPDLSRVYDLRDINELRARFAVVCKYFFAGGIVIVTIISAFARSFILFLSKEEFTEGVPVLIILVAASFIYSIFRLNTVLINVMKATAMLGGIWVILGLLSIALNIILIGKLGVEGASLACLLVFLMGLMVTVPITFRKFNLTRYFKLSWLIKPVSAALIIGCAAVCLSSNIYIDVLLIAPLAFILYWALLWTLGFVENSEIDFIWDILPRNFRPLLTICKSIRF